MSRAFTLIEILIVVGILGILAAIVIPKFTDAAGETTETAVARTLQIVRHQVEYYRARERAEPDLIGNQWGDLLQNDYLHSVPRNPMNWGTRVAAAPAVGVGWVWRDDGSGLFDVFATDTTWISEFAE
jgi:prepilin-type N-terminal cleavage/methylation domain-containing protein